MLDSLSNILIFLPTTTLLETFRIQGDALLGNESNVEYEALLTYGKKAKDNIVSARSCLFKSDGLLADFINDARGDDFVGQSWMKYRSACKDLLHMS